MQPTDDANIILAGVRICLLGRKQTRSIARLSRETYNRDIMKARDRLRKFTAIEIVEDFNRSLISTCLSCGVTPPAEEEIVTKNRTDSLPRVKRDKIDDETIELLNELTEYDRAIYDYGKELHNEQLIMHGMEA